MSLGGHLESLAGSARRPNIVVILADEYPDRVKAMTETWRQWAQQRHVLPWPYKPAWDNTL